MSDAAPDPARGEAEPTDPASAAGPGPDLGADPAEAGGTGAEVAPDSLEAELERVIAQLEQVTAERDHYLDEAKLVAADFSNFRKQNERRQAEQSAQAGAGVVESILPVLDACDAALQQGAADVEPIRDMIRDLLGQHGLEVVETVDTAFDPTVHEAVMVDTSGAGGDQVVAEILRTGYVFNGRVLRAAMVKVRS